MRKAGPFITAFAVVATIVFLLTCGCDKQQPKKRCCPGPCPTTVQVVVFTASWCGPCQRAKPMLLQLQVAGVDVRIIDIDEQPELARKNGVTSVPTYFVRTRYKSVRTNSIAEVLVLIGRQT